MNGTELHAASAGAFTRMLANLSGCLDKAAAFAAEKKFDPDVLFVARLAPDMLTLTGQIHLATAFAKNAAHRLAGTTPPNFTDLEPTLTAARARVAETQGILAAVKPADLEGGGAREITVQLGPDRSMTASGADYLSGFVLPNFYFHLTTAYAILRHNGVPLGKMDFMGPPPSA